MSVLRQMMAILVTIPVTSRQEVGFIIRRGVKAFEILFVQDTETVNKRMKQFGALLQVFRHDPRKHAIVFESVAVLTQLSIENGNPLFEINGYNDNNYNTEVDD
jgi:hypothetical protein